jgi:hypothetical protein
MLPIEATTVKNLLDVLIKEYNNKKSYISIYQN